MAYAIPPAAILGIAAEFINSVSSVSAHKNINADRVTLQIEGLDDDVTMGQAFYPAFAKTCE